MVHIEETIRERQQFINRNMFEDDEHWDLCYENFKLIAALEEEENNSTNQESKQPSKTLDELKKELA
jgi:hypothetical protein